MRRTRLTDALLVISALGTGGCLKTSEAMIELAAPSIHSSSEGEATVVFIRPSATAPDTVVTILSSGGQFIGDSIAGSCFARSMSPGEHVFVGAADNVSVMTAELGSKRTYFVEVAVNSGALSVRSHLFAVRRGERDPVGRVGRWLRECTFYAVDADVGQAQLNRDREAMLRQIRSAELALTKYPQREIERRTLRAEDGR